ncbi:MAG: hypothetical protein WBH99_04030 [Azovibrio sp.]|uniref:hypothetical protein n=1 Tax=Azovibrio sp. TaxID=1872673 RepID=UPI003C752C18
MPATISAVITSGHFLTSDEQGRHVTKIEDGKVWYENRSFYLKNESLFGHTRTNPQSIQVFAQTSFQVL